jgi:hypothetical protein
VSLLSSSGWYLFVMAWRGDGGYGSLDGSGEVREVQEEVRCVLCSRR